MRVTQRIFFTFFFPFDFKALSFAFYSYFAQMKYLLVFALFRIIPTFVLVLPMSLWSLKCVALTWLQQWQRLILQLKPTFVKKAQRYAYTMSRCNDATLLVLPRNRSTSLIKGPFYKAYEFL